MKQNRILTVIPDDLGIAAGTASAFAAMSVERFTYGDFACFLHTDALLSWALASWRPAVSTETTLAVRAISMTLAYLAEIQTTAHDRSQTAGLSFPTASKSLIKLRQRF